MANHIISSLKALGCKVEERETTAGAIKWWLKRPEGVSKVAVLRAAHISTYKHLEKRLFCGDGFDLEFFGEIVFIAKYRKGRRGGEYAHGIDC